jgi:hypothetical protein
MHYGRLSELPSVCSHKIFFIFFPEHYALWKAHRTALRLSRSSTSHYFALNIMHYRRHTELPPFCSHQALLIILNLTLFITEDTQDCPSFVPIKHFTLFCTKYYVQAKAHNTVLRLFPSSISNYFALDIMQYRRHTEPPYVSFHQGIHIILH